MTALYAGSRQVVRSAVWLVVFGAIALLWGQYQLHVPSLRSGAAVVPVLVVVPLGSAVVIGISTKSWQKDLEDTAALPLARWRLAHALALPGLAALLLVPGMLAASGDYGPAAAVRNLLGYVGLAYMCATVAGAGLSWVLPIAYALPATVIAGPSPSLAESWTWPVHHASSAVSWAWALALAAVGIAVFVRFSTRQPPAEEPLDAA